MDGVVVAQQTVIVVLAITRDGTQVPLGLRLGSTENAVVGTELLQDLLAHELPLDIRVLCILDGSKGLRKEPAFQRPQTGHTRHAAPRFGSAPAGYIFQFAYARGEPTPRGLAGPQPRVELVQARLRAIRAAKPDRSLPDQVADDDAVGVALLDRDLTRQAITRSAVAADGRPLPTRRRRRRARRGPCDGQIAGIGAASALLS
jgi:hypothetical protein